MSTIDGEDSEKLLSLNVAVWDAEDKLDAAKKVAARAAAELKLAMLRLRKFKGELAEEHPLFDRPEPTAAMDGHADDWREVLCVSLDLNVDQVEALHAREIEDLGQLADFLEEDGCRALMAGDKEGFNLDFDDSAKVFAALSLWWGENRKGPLPFTPEGDSPADRERVAMLVDWLKRKRSGDTEPRWDRWSEFDVTLESHEGVRVIFEPGGSSVQVGQFGFHGPLTKTGYRRYFADERDAAGKSIVEFAEKFARKIHAETLKEFGKAEKPAKPKAAPKRKPKAKPKAEVIDTDLESVLAAESDADEPDEPLWAGLGVASLRVPGPVHGKLLDAGVKTLGQLPELLASYTDKRLSAQWDTTIQETEAVRAAFHAIANHKPEAVSA